MPDSAGTGAAAQPVHVLKRSFVTRSEAAPLVKTAVGNAPPASAPSWEKQGAGP